MFTTPLGRADEVAENTSEKDNVLVAQLVEQLTLNQWVQGSNPCQDTTLRGVAQLASAPRSGRGGRKFESSHPDNNPKTPRFTP